MNKKILVLLLIAITCTTKNTTQATTALHYAAQTGNRDDIKRLITFGFDINAKDEYGWQPLHYAAFNGHRACVEELLQQRATIFSKDNHGCTALHYAAGRGHASCLSMLLKAGAAINAKNIEGITPLHVAIFYGHYNCVLILVEKGASLNDTISRGALRGSTPEMLATLRGYNNLARLLRTSREERNSRFCYGVCTALSTMLCDRSDT